MKILLDHNLDRRLKVYLSDFDCSTVHECGWSNVQNGELLSLAEAVGFSVLLTADSNIKTQQNLSKKKISILVIRALDNRLATHVEMLEDVRVVLLTISTGEVVEVFHPRARRA